jgi:aminoglycoside 6'-N-acetyltransferase I
MTHILDLPSDDDAIEQAAGILISAFHEHAPIAWATMDDALEEVRDMLNPAKIARVAVDAVDVDSGRSTIVGLIGGAPQYDGRVWELHPLAVRPDRQKQGIGRLLIQDFEMRVKAHGALTIILGSDDEDNMTTLSGVDLYDNLWERIAHIRNLKRHPYEFYEKCGYTIVGVVPDANGWGKPDIIMGKRINHLQASLPNR